MSKDFTRRDVLKGSAAALVGLAATGGATASSLKKSIKSSENRRLRTAVIGAGGKGWSGMQWAAQAGGEIVAICDIDLNNRYKAMQEYPGAASFEDYRDMYEAMGENLEAVIISTPDHHHAPASAMAMRLGIHTYCEKPLTRTIWEARELANIAKRHGVASQMGNQSTASTNMRQAAALIAKGTYGAVKEIHLWTDRAGGWWPQGHTRPPAERTPKEVNFGLWLGPRPDRNYAQGYHPFAWRGYWDFGTGSLGDMGCHIFNMPHMALDLSQPLAVQAQTSGHNRDTFPEWAIVTYDFGGRRNQPPFKLTWYDGGKRPDPDLVPGAEYGGNGVIVVCEQATIYGPDSSNTNFSVHNVGPLEDIEVDVSPGHMEEFYRAANGGPAAVANIDHYAGPLTEAVLLGNLAIWADGPRVEWDARRLRTPGTDEFDSLIKPEFRPGWAF